MARILRALAAAAVVLVSFGLAQFIVTPTRPVVLWTIAGVVAAASALAAAEAEEEDDG